MTPQPYDEQSARRLEHAERRWLADARARLSSRSSAARTTPARPTPTRPEADR
jgi:hypothetical protein